MRANGFTLIELLVVIAIISLLATMVYAAMGMVGGSRDRRDTEIVIMTISSAIDIFISDVGAVPLPSGSRTDVDSGSWYPDDYDGTWEKQQLYWRLGYAMSTDAKVAAETAAWTADLAADPYQSFDYIKEQNPDKSNVERIAIRNTILGIVSNEEAEPYRGNMPVSSWGTEDAVGSWSNTIRGQVKSYILNIRGALAYDAERRKYVTFDVFDKEDLPDSSFLDGETLLDAWGNPLVYVARSTPAVAYRYPKDRGRSHGLFPVGKTVSGRIEVTDRNSDGVVDSDDWAVAPPVGTGDMEDQLDHQIDQNNDSTIDEDDWGNILYYARPGNGTGYFLASPGEDGMFHCVWSHEANQDNIINRLAKE